MESPIFGIVENPFHLEREKKTVSFRKNKQIPWGIYVPPYFYLVLKMGKLTRGPLVTNLSIEAGNQL